MTDPASRPGSSRSVLRALVVVTGVLTAGCGAVRALAPAGLVSTAPPESGGGRVVLPVTIDAPVLQVPAAGRPLTGHETAVRGIAAIMVADLGLPLPREVMVYVYDSRQHFEQGLVRDAQVASSRAAELSQFAVGVGRRRQLLLNDAAYEHHGREWLRLIAHELTHVAQIDLADGEGRGEQWLAEGMAEWVAFSVLERLSLDTLAERRAFAAAGIRNHAAMAAARLDLESLGTPRGFTVRHLQEGSVPTYQLAFLMADYLIGRDGLGRVADYFRACAVHGDRHAHFEHAFGQSLAAFEQEVLAHLERMVRSRRASAR